MAEEKNDNNLSNGTSSVIGKLVVGGLLIGGLAKLGYDAIKGCIGADKNSSNAQAHPSLTELYEEIDRIDAQFHSQMSKDIEAVETKLCNLKKHLSVEKNSKAEAIKVAKCLRNEIKKLHQPIETHRAMLGNELQKLDKRRQQLSVDLDELKNKNKQLQGELIAHDDKSSLLENISTELCKVIENGVKDRDEKLFERVFEEHGAPAACVVGFCRNIIGAYHNEDINDDIAKWKQNKLSILIKEHVDKIIVKYGSKIDELNDSIKAISTECIKIRCDKKTIEGRVESILQLILENKFSVNLGVFIGRNEMYSYYRRFSWETANHITECIYDNFITPIVKDLEFDVNDVEAYVNNSIEKENAAEQKIISKRDELGRIDARLNNLERNTISITCNLLDDI